MITRKFEQEWEQIVSPINRRIENNVIFDFFDYLVDMRKDLMALKKDYESDFNRLSGKNLDHYITLFEKRLKQYASICIKNYNRTKIFGHNQSFEDFREDVVFQNGSHFKINDKYYPTLKKIAESIFKIEDEMSKTVSSIWIKELTDIKDYSLTGNYLMLAHTSILNTPFEETSEELREHIKNQKGQCFSLITDKKTRLYSGSNISYNYYSNPNGAVGIIVKPSIDAFIGMSKDDMLSTEYINGKCPLPNTFDHSNINVCYEDENSKICCKGTKICPPKEIFNINVDTINEIILVKSKMNVEAVFYVENSRNEIPENFEAYKKQQEELCGHKLKTIKLVPRNKMNQINLDELYSMY